MNQCQEKSPLDPREVMTTIRGSVVRIRRLLAVKLRGQSKLRNKCVSKVWELGDGLSRVPAADGLAVQGKASRRTKCKAHVPGPAGCRRPPFLQLCGVLGSRSHPPPNLRRRQESASGIRCAEYFLPMSHKKERVDPTGKRHWLAGPTLRANVPEPSRVAF